MAPGIYRDFESFPPQWFSAITCAIWLRLIFRGRGSAWVFGAHLLLFHGRGWILEAGVGFWNPEVDILARGRFLPDLGVLKKIVLQRNGFVVRIQGGPSCPNEFYVPWEPYGQATLPKTLLIQLFSRDFQFSWKTAGGPCHLPVYPLCNSRCTALAAAMLRCATGNPRT